MYFVSAVSITFLTVVTFQTSGVWKELSWVLLGQYLPMVIIFYFEVKNKNFRTGL
jgi:hypothetical protein